MFELGDVQSAVSQSGSQSRDGCLAVGIGSPAEVIRRFLLTTLPVDAQRRSEALVWLAFSARAVHYPELATVLREIDQEVRTELAGHLSAAGVSTRPLVLADALIAVSDGLASRMFLTPGEEHNLLDALDLSLSRLLAR